MDTPNGLTMSSKKSLERFFSRLLAMINRRIKIKGVYRLIVARPKQDRAQPF
jgi:hypothetical protein